MPIEKRNNEIDDTDIDALLAEMDADFSDAVNEIPLKKKEAKPAAEQQAQPDGDEQPPAPVEEPPVDNEQQPHAEIADKAAMVAGDDNADDDKARLQEQLDEANRKLEAANNKPVTEQTVQQEDPVADQQPQDPMESLSEEEKQVLQSYEDDWDTVAKAEAIHRKVLSNRVAIMFGELYKHMQSQIEQLAAQLDQTVDATNTTMLKAEYNNYDGLMKNVQQWVSKQSNLVKPAYTAALESRDPDKIGQVIAEYEKAVGSTPGQKQPAGKVDKPSAEQQDTLDAMAPVSRRRSAIPAGQADKFDEEGAFEEALAQMGLGS